MFANLPEHGHSLLPIVLLLCYGGKLLARKKSFLPTHGGANSANFQIREREGAFFFYFLESSVW